MKHLLASRGVLVLTYGLIEQAMVASTIADSLAAVPKPHGEDVREDARRRTS